MDNWFNHLSIKRMSRFHLLQLTDIHNHVCRKYLSRVQYQLHVWVLGLPAQCPAESGLVGELSVHVPGLRTALRCLTCAALKAQATFKVQLCRTLLTKSLI